MYGNEPGVPNVSTNVYTVLLHGSTDWGYFVQNLRQHGFPLPHCPYVTYKAVKMNTLRTTKYLYHTH